MHFGGKEFWYIFSRGVGNALKIECLALIKGGKAVVFSGASFCHMAEDKISIGEQFPILLESPTLDTNFIPSGISLIAHAQDFRMESMDTEHHLGPDKTRPR